MRRTPHVVFVSPSRKTTGTMEEAGTTLVAPAAPPTLAGAVPKRFDVKLRIVDEAIQRFNPLSVEPGDIVSVSILTYNCLRAYEVARLAIERGATVILGGPHATLLPDEALDHGHAVVRGDADTILGQVLEDALTGKIRTSGMVYEDRDEKDRPMPFRAKGHEMVYPRWDLMDVSKYWFTTLRSINGCRENCTFCTVPGISGRVPIYRPVEAVAREVSELHDRGFRFIFWGADNLVPVPLSTITKAIEDGRRATEIEALEAAREKSFAYFREFHRLTGAKKLWGGAQLTLRLHDDPEMLRVLRKEANIFAALFGIESIAPEALRRMAKRWNGSTPEEIAERIRNIEYAGIRVLASVIIGYPTDTLGSIAALRRFAVASEMTALQLARFDLFPGSPDFEAAKRRLSQRQSANPLTLAPTTADPAVELLDPYYWLNSNQLVPHTRHPLLSHEVLRAENRKTWRHFYRLPTLLRNGLRRGATPLVAFTFALVGKTYAGFYGGVDKSAADVTQISRMPFPQRKLLELGAWLVRKIPPPRVPAL